MKEVVKRPIDIIREMNPGVFIPTGQELSDLLNTNELVEKLKKFGIKEKLTIDEYAIWLDTFEAMKFLDGIEIPHKTFGSSEDRMVTKNNMITMYAAFLDNLKS